MKENEFIQLDSMPDMAELLSSSGEQKTDYSEGNMISGVIVERRDSGVLVDIGYKAEGFVSKIEFKDWDNVAIGQKIEVLLEAVENDNGMPKISFEKAVVQKSWDAILDSCNEGDEIEGEVKYRVKGGLVVDVGVDAFLPGSHVDIGPVKNLDDFLDKKLKFKVLKINGNRRNIILSRRELLEDVREGQKDELLKVISKGDIRKGTVKNITSFGVFVDLDGMDGLLHITDMSWGRISHPSEMVEMEQEIEVIILDIDEEKKRVSLGLKQKVEDPWKEIGDLYSVGTKIKGRVVNIMPYGAFIELQSGVEGLIHVSEMSWTKRITRASDVLMIGQEVEAIVLEIQIEDKKISLGLRQATDNPWEKLVKDFPPGTLVKGPVRNLTSYGAFVEVCGDIDGMIHVSDISWTKKINNPAEVYKKGDIVETVLLEVDPSNQRVSLGVKQLQEDPWEKISEIYTLEQKVKGRVSKLTNYGAFVELDKGVDGLIHITQLSEKRVEKVKDIVNVGDEIEAFVIKIDTDDRRIGLSLKAERDSFVSKKETKAKEVSSDMSDIFDSLEGLDMDSK